MTEELTEVLAEAVDTGSLPAGALQRVGNAALAELLGRLEDPEEARKLPGTGLLQLANAYVRQNEKELAKEATRPEVDERDDVDLIVDSTFTNSQKAEQLRQALARCDDKRRRIHSLIEELTVEDE